VSDAAGATNRGLVLVVDDDASVARVLAATLRQEGFTSRTAKSGEEALALLDAEPFDAVVTDLRMPKMDGLELIAEIRRRGLDLPVIVITAHGSIPVAVDAMRRGAADFVTKPFEREEIAFVLGKALAGAGHDAEPDRVGTVLAAAVASSPIEAMLPGTSPAMRATKEQLTRAARTHATVLLRGESGTGKDVAARALHAASARAPGPFVKVHCGALPDALLESELFGHERGAFTGAVARKPGRVELAQGGTLFLDEIGDVTPAVQVKLLELLQDRAFFRVGGEARVEADVRFVAATHRDLEAMVAKGELREDLYYRLMVVPVVMPPLRERTGDVATIVRELVPRIGKSTGREDVTLSAAAVERLAREAWPGNVRQLANTIERLVVLADGAVVESADVEKELRRVPPIRRDGAPAPIAASTDAPADDSGLEATRVRAERVAIDEALGRAGGNKVLAARLLGISRRTLYNKLEAQSPKAR
jgi:two-component system response regulator AtoC